MQQAHIALHVTECHAVIKRQTHRDALEGSSEWRLE